MTNLNETFAARLEKLGIRVPEVFLPAPGTDLHDWSVVACDQHVSARDYWASVEKAVGDSPSTLHLILPEVYLEEPDVPERVQRIRRTMQRYLDENVLTSRGEGLVYVRRTTPTSGLREGLMVAIDLERYDYSRGSKSLVRATEGTITDRIPPRLAVRRGAPLELPHVMVLIQDAERQLIEGWGQRLDQLERLYEVELMQGGGHLEGYRIHSPEHVAALLGALERLLAQAIADQGTSEPLFFAMGDGNHSLATAKASWEETKARLGQSGAILTHPARWALVELVNVHSAGLRFEPIHRVVFTGKLEALTSALRAETAIEHIAPIGEEPLKALLASPEGQRVAGYYDGDSFLALTLKPGLGLPPAIVDAFFGRFHQTDPQAKIDFVHGWAHARDLADQRQSTRASAGVFLLPVLGRDRLFGHVAEHGPLPRKSFSMGDAEEKRYYMEARRITL